MPKTQNIVWPLAFLPGLSTTGSCGFTLSPDLWQQTLQEDAWACLGLQTHQLLAFHGNRKGQKWEKRSCNKNILINDNQANSWATRKCQNPSKCRSQRRCWHHTETLSAPWTLLERGLCVCVCVCEPKPECQKDQGRGDKREECCLGLIRALLSGLRFLSITESGTKERDRGVWLEFQRALVSASLSSLGLVWLVLFFPPLSKL